MEGILVIPLFLFFMFLVLLSLELVRFQSNVAEALHSVSCYQSVQNFKIPYNNLQQAVSENVKKQPNAFLGIKKGSNGLLVSDYSSISKNGMISIQADYCFAPDIANWLEPVLTFHDGCYGHAFVGYSPQTMYTSNQVEEKYVYVTETGTRYHYTPDCYHLAIKPEMVVFTNIPQLRNEDGGKYYACERCRPENLNNVLITKDGNRYHAYRDCSSLKREIFLIPLNQAGKYSPCKNCTH